MNDPARVRARELMRREVDTLAPDDTIETALSLFEDSRISGAPVVANGTLVGVLTLTDVSRTEHLKDGRLETRRDYEMSEPAGEERADEIAPDEVIYLKEDYSPEVLGRELVGDWMTNEVVSVPPDASLESVCRVMADRRIHRVFVTEERRLVGVISAFDVVRHVAGRSPAREGRARP